MNAMAFLQWLWHASWQAAALATAVYLLLRLAHDRLPAGWRYALWGVVIVRLVLPATLPTRFSPFEALRQTWQQWPIKTGDAIRASAGAVEAAPPQARQSAEPRLVVRVGVGAAEQVNHGDADAQPLPREWPWTTMLLAIWAAGAILRAARLALAHADLLRRVRQDGLPAGVELRSIFDGCRRRMGVIAPVELLLTDAAGGPALLGWWRPRVLLPTELAGSLSVRQLRLIFLHELAHLKRRDIAVDCLCAALSVMHWFNPLIGWAIRRFQAEREICRDAMVLSASSPADERLYGMTLLQLASGVAVRPSPAVVGIGPGASRLRQRIAMIIAYKREPGKFSRLGLCLLALLGWAALTDCAGRNETPSDGAMTTRVYDIRDLLASIPNFDAPPSLAATRSTSRPAASGGNAAASSQPVSAQPIIDQIRLAAGTDSWNAGAKIDESHGSLVVSQTPAAHAKIAAALEQIRRKRFLQIMIETRFIAIDAAIAKHWIETAGAQPEHALNTEQVNALLKETQANDQGSIISAPRITLFNGQRAWVQIANQQAYISDWHKKTSAAGKVEYEPVIDVASSGLMLDAQASADPDGGVVSLKLHPQLSELQGMSESDFPAPDADRKLRIQQPILRVHEIRTSVNVPNNATLLLGGQILGDDAPPATRFATTSPSVLNALIGPKAKGKTLLILVKPTILKEPADKGASFPPLSTKVKE